MRTEEPRVVVTGAGMIASIGAGSEQFEAALYAGQTAFGPSELAPGGGAAAEVRNFAPETWLGRKGLRTLDRSARLLSVAAHLALEDAELTGEGADGALEPGMICGTMFGSVHSIASFDWSALEEGAKYVNPMHFPNTVISASAGQAALRHGLRGVNSTCCAGLASGLYALQYAVDSLRLGRARVLVAGGVEEVCEESMFGFRQAHIASPSGRPRPFAGDSDGTVPGEGAALWVLETEETAARRGVRPALEICGFGAAHDAFSIDGFHREGTGSADAMAQALDDAGIKPEEIACIVASASGSRPGDDMEARALRQIFGESLTEIPLLAPKAALGETMGAAGALGALIAGIALRRRCLPPTAGIETSNSGLRLSSEPQSIRGEYALVNAFGCDGNNASLVLRSCR